MSRVTVVGAGTRFLSGVSYYTMRLSNALADRHAVSAILMRQMLPSRFYPGRARVGASLTTQRYNPVVRVFDGVDWYWIPSIVSAMALLVRERPRVIIFQWWTGTVLHSYLLLALVATLLRARVIVEYHEILDTGEAKMPLVDRYVRTVSPLLIRLAHGFVIHSEFDRQGLEERYHLGRRPVRVIPHGPFDHHRPGKLAAPLREAAPDVFNLLYAGVIRPFKGLEDLVRAFDAIPPDEIASFWLTVVGETWENWELPADLIARSRYRDRITFVNRYVSDDELASAFAGADAVVLPYHRSSASGPLHTAMSLGLPVVVTAVGGLTEAVSEYKGATLVPPQSPSALLKAMMDLTSHRGARYDDPHSWQRTVEGYDRLFAELLEPTLDRQQAA